MDDFLEVDDIVTGKAAEQLGEGVIPVSAVLIVETMNEGGPGLRYVLSHRLSAWHAMGMVASVLKRIETDDLASWDDE